MLQIIYQFAHYSLKLVVITGFQACFTMIIQFNKITIDTKTFDVSRDGEHIDIEPKVYDLIVYLIKNRERVVSRDDILENVWQGVIVSDTSLSNRIKSARQVLGDDGQLQHTIKTVHGRGYQFVAEIDAAKTPENPSNKIAKVSKTQRLLLIFGLVVLALIINGYWVTKSNQPNRNVMVDDSLTMAQKSIAVLPFSKTKPNEETNYLSFALANQIIGNFDYLEKFTIRPAGTIRKYTHKILDPIEIGKELKVDYVLTGNYIKENNIIRLNVELINIKNNEIIWQEPIQVDYSNTFALQDIVTTKVAQGLKASFSSQGINRKESNIPKNPLAYEYYLRGVSYANTKEDNQLAIAMLNKSIELESDYVLSQAELGHRYRLIAAYDHIDINGYKKAEKQLLQTLALDHYSMRALKNLVYLYTDMDEAAKALEMAQRMLAINPNNITSYAPLTRLYFYTGMNELAVKIAEKAYKLDPKNYYNHNLGITYFNAGFYQKGVDFINSFDKQRSNGSAQLWLGMNYQRLGQNDKALDTFKNLAFIKTNSELSKQASLINIAILEKNKVKGLKALDNAQHIFLTQARLLSWASYYAYFGEKQTSLTMMKKAVVGGFYNIGEIQRNPFFDSLKDDKKFQEILALAKQKHVAFKQETENRGL